MCMPPLPMDSREEDAALSRHRLHSEDTPETVVIRYGEDGEKRLWPVIAGRW